MVSAEQNYMAKPVAIVWVNAHSCQGTARNVNLKEFRSNATHPFQILLHGLCRPVETASGLFMSVEHTPQY